MSNDKKTRMSLEEVKERLTNEKVQIYKAKLNEIYGFLEITPDILSEVLKVRPIENDYEALKWLVFTEKFAKLDDALSFNMEFYIAYLMFTRKYSMKTIREMIKEEIRVVKHSFKKIPEFKEIKDMLKQVRTVQKRYFIPAHEIEEMYQHKFKCDKCGKTIRRDYVVKAMVKGKLLCSKCRKKLGIKSK